MSSFGIACEVRLDSDDLDWVHVLHRTAKEGLGRAYLAGFRWALDQGYDYICEMDCDFSHDPGRLPDLVAARRARAL